MVDLLSSAALVVVQLLLLVLPDSFIESWLSGAADTMSALSVGLGVLNWFVDVNGMVILLSLWSIAAMAFYAWRFGMFAFNSLHEFVGGASGFFGLLGDGGGE